jgi:hypothetical protein
MIADGCDAQLTTVKFDATLPTLSGMANQVLMRLPQGNSVQTSPIACLP